MLCPPLEQRPRVAFLGARGVPARYGGFETFVEELGARLVERGVEVTVYCETEGGRDAPLDAHRGMALRHVRPWAPGPARTIQVDVEGLARCMAGQDLVILLGYGAAFAAWLPRVTGAKVWINPDGIEWQRSKWGRPARAWLALMERVACRSASRLIFDNAALARSLEERLGRALPPHAVLAYGARALPDDVPADPLASLGLAPGGYDLMLCRFEPENHVAEIVEAHRRAETGRPLVAVGNSDLGTPYVRRVLEGAHGGVRFLGPLYEPALLDPLRRHAHLYVHGHSVGGTNPSLLEAMGAGSVVLAHDNPFNREVLGLERDVYWRDVDELVERLRLWSDGDGQEHAAAGRDNRERIRRDYDWDRLADAYRALIAEDVGR